MENNRQYLREPARRIFAQELQDSNLTIKEGDEQYSPQYLITPTGAKTNRLYIAGTLIEKEDIGDENEYWRARITDPTGVFFVYAGQYQQEVADMIARTETPAFVSIIGKISTYTTKDETFMISIRPETLQITDEDTIDQWIIDTAQQTLHRIQNRQTTIAQQADTHYSGNLQKYKDMVKTAIETIT